MEVEAPGKEKRKSTTTPPSRSSSPKRIKNDLEDYYTFYGDRCSRGLHYDRNSPLFCRVSRMLEYLRTGLDEISASINRDNPLVELINDRMSLITEAQDTLQDFEPHVIAVLGDTGIGKSFFINMLLFVTESNDYGLLVQDIKMSENDLRLFLTRSLDAFKKLKSAAPSDWQDTVELRVLTAKESHSADFEQKKKDDTAAIQEVCEFWKDKSKDTQLQYLLPILSDGGTGSTTADLVLVKFGSIFHFHIQFLSEKKILDELENYDWEGHAADYQKGQPDKSKEWDVMLMKYLHFCEPDKETDVLLLKVNNYAFDFKLRNEQVKKYAGKSIVVSGRGFDAQEDRIYVRDELERILGDRGLALAVEEIEVFCPSDLLAEGIALEDVPGTNDTDPRKFKLAQEAVESADTVLVVTKDNIGVAAATRDMMTNCGLFEGIVQKEDTPRVLFLSLQNEVMWKWDAKTFLSKKPAKDGAKTNEAFSKNGWTDKVKATLVSVLDQQFNALVNEDEDLRLNLLNGKTQQDYINKCRDDLEAGHFCCRVLLWASALAGKGLMDPSGCQQSDWEACVSTVGCERLILKFLENSQNSVLERVKRVKSVVEDVKPLVSSGESKSKITPAEFSLPHLNDQEMRVLVEAVESICNRSFKSQSASKASKRSKQMDQVEHLGMDRLWDSFNSFVLKPTDQELYDKEASAMILRLEGLFKLKSRHTQAQFRDTIRHFSDSQIRDIFHPDREGRHETFLLRQYIFGSKRVDHSIGAEGLEMIHEFSDTIRNTVVTKLKDWATKELLESTEALQSGRRTRQVSKSQAKGGGAAPTGGDSALAKCISESVSLLFEGRVRSKIQETLTSYFGRDRALRSFSSKATLKNLWSESMSQFMNEIIREVWDSGPLHRSSHVSELDRNQLCSWFGRSVEQLGDRMKKLFLDRLRDKISESMSEFKSKMLGIEQNESRRRGHPMYLFLIRHGLRPLFDHLKGDHETDPVDAKVSLLLKRANSFLCTEVGEDASARVADFWTSDQISRRFQLRAKGKFHLTDAQRRFDLDEPDTGSKNAQPLRLVYDPTFNMVCGPDLDARLGLDKYEPSPGYRLVAGEAATDGNCLFHSLSRFIESGPCHDVQALRTRLVDYVLENHTTPEQKERFENLYLNVHSGGRTLEAWADEMKRDTVWGDDVIIDAFARMLQTRVMVHQVSKDDDPKPPSCFPLEEALSSFPAYTAENLTGSVHIAFVSCSGSPHALEMHFIPLYRKEKEEQGSVTVISSTLARLNQSTRELLEKRKIPLVLDLDDTLILDQNFPSARPFRGAVLCSTLGPSFKHLDRYMALRPHVYESLARLSKFFLLGIYTTESQQWAECFLALIKNKEEELGIEAKDVFEPDRVLVVHPKAKKSFEHIFPEYDPDICLAIDDQKSQWQDQDQDQVIEVDSFRKRLNQNFSDAEHLREVNGWEKKLDYLRRQLLGQFGIRYMDGQPPNPPMPLIGIKMGRLCARMLESESSLLKIDATDSSSLGSKQDCHVLKHAECGVNVFLDGDVLLGSKHSNDVLGVYDLCHMALSCGVSTFVLPPLNDRIAMWGSCRQGRRRRVAEQIATARRWAQPGGPQVLAVATQLPPPGPDAPLRHREAMALALAAEEVGAFVASDSEFAQEACTNQLVQWVLSLELSYHLKKTMEERQPEDRQAVIREALVSAARSNVEGAAVQDPGEVASESEGHEGEAA